MTRRVAAWAAGAVLAVIVIVVAVMYGGALMSGRAGDLSLAADVRAQSVIVQAPVIVYPVIDPTIGIPTATQAAPSGAHSSAASAGASSRAPVVSGRATVVYVAQGSTVTTGQPLVQLDTAMLDLGVTQARAAAKRARTQVSVLNSTLDTLSDSAGTIATAKSKLATARTKLLNALTQATAGREQLVRSIAALEKMIAHLPSGPPPTSTVPPGGTNPRALLAQLKAKLKQLDAGIAALRKGLAQVASGGAQLATATSQLSKARTQLEIAHDVAAIAAQAQELGITVAEVERDQARVLSPTSGVVTSVLQAGSIAMVGSPLVTIAPDRPVLVDTYVDDSQAPTVKVGDTADVTYDSDAEAVLHGRVRVIGSSSTFPPTSFPTDLIHLTRAVRVTITLDRGPAPPPGTPVDLVIHTNG